ASTMSSTEVSPSAQSEWQCRSPRSSGRRALSPSAPAAARSSARYPGTSPASTSSTTRTVVSPMPGRRRSRAVSASSSALSVATTSAAVRNAFDLYRDDRSRSSSVAISVRASSGSMLSVCRARMTGVSRLMLLDTAALYFRAFYGVPDTVRSPDGQPVNAVRGLLDIIARLVAEYEPTDLVACWDDDWRPQWRVDLIPSYKAHRVAEEVAAGPDVEVVPDPLEAQVPVIRETLTALGIAIASAAEHEADDVSGTLATTARMPVDVVTGDRDLFQLVDDARDVRVIYTARGMSNLEIVTDDAVRARYGVLPSQYGDFATLRGDPSDGLPGVAGVGEK